MYSRTVSARLGHRRLFHDSASDDENQVQRTAERASHRQSPAHTTPDVGADQCVYSRTESAHLRSPSPPLQLHHIPRAGTMRPTMETEAHFTHDTYLSPFAWRYGSQEMRAIWSEAHKRRLWRRVWVALAAAQEQAGVVMPEQLADVRRHEGALDMARSAEIEAEIHHDLVAELRCFAEQCAIGGGILHLGATSADIEDNADVIRLQESLDLLLDRTHALLTTLAERIEAYADHVCLGFTHLQPAEPTTVGYRLAGYAQDLLSDYDELQRVRARLRAKGIKGAVGTRTAYAQMLAPHRRRAAARESNRFIHTRRCFFQPMNLSSAQAM